MREIQLTQGKVAIILAFAVRNGNNRIDALEVRILHLERQREAEKDRLKFSEADRKENNGHNHV